MLIHFLRVKIKSNIHDSENCPGYFLEQSAHTAVVGCYRASDKQQVLCGFSYQQASVQVYDRKWFSKVKNAISSQLTFLQRCLWVTWQHSQHGAADRCHVELQTWDECRVHLDHQGGEAPAGTRRRGDGHDGACETEGWFHDIMTWNYWPFVRGIHRWPVDSPYKWPVTRDREIDMTAAVG